MLRKKKKGSSKCYNNLAREPASLFGERVKKSRGEGRERVRACKQTFEVATPPSCLVIADYLSARSLSVTWVHWNVITLACKKGIGSQHTTFAPCQNTALSNEFLLWRVDYVLECLSLISY